MKKIKSRPGLFGSTVHYNERGQNVGSSYKGRLKTDHYGKNGKVGSSYKYSRGSDTWLDED